VAAAISTNATPPSNGGDTTLEMLGSRATEKPIARANYVSSEYFPLLQIPVMQGRVWNGDEIKRGAALVVILGGVTARCWRLQ
jgi:putative ABC transport system permease protein